jgi:hypothetical protein
VFIFVEIKKIAACGGSYMDLAFIPGAAAGCDLLETTQNQR